MFAATVAGKNIILNMNQNNCKITGIHQPVQNGNYFQCRFCHKLCDMAGTLIEQENKPFDKDELYANIVKTYMGPKHNMSKEKANDIAKIVVERELKRNGNNSSQQENKFF